MLSTVTVARHWPSVQQPPQWAGHCVIRHRHGSSWIHCHRWNPVCWLHLPSLWPGEMDTKWITKSLCSGRECFESEKMWTWRVELCMVLNEWWRWCSYVPNHLCCSCVPSNLGCSCSLAFSVATVFTALHAAAMFQAFCVAAVFLAICVAAVFLAIFVAAVFLAVCLAAVFLAFCVVASF